MGQGPSDRRNPSRERKNTEPFSERSPPQPVRQVSLPEGACRAQQDNINAAPAEACAGHNKAVVMPFHKWLTMNDKLQQRHIQYARNCILSPFLFKRRHEYSEKVFVWLHRRDLLPKMRNMDTLTDKNLEVLDYAEEVTEIVLSGMTRKDFLYDVYQVREQLNGCDGLVEVLRIAEDSELVQVVWKCSTLVGNLVREDLLLLVMSVLHQALLHIEMTSDSRVDVVEDFEQQLRQKAQVCERLKLRGNQYFKERKFRQASDLYSKAINMRPFDHVLYGNRAQSYLNSTQYREALSDARRAICLNPGWEKGHFRYAKAYYELGYYEKAIAVNTNALKSCSRTEELRRQAEEFNKSSVVGAVAANIVSDNRGSSREKARKAKLGLHETASSLPNSKRKRLNSLGQSCMSSPHRRPSEEGMIVGLPSMNEEPGTSAAHGDQPSPNIPEARERTRDDKDGGEDDKACTCGECDCDDMDSLPSLNSEASLSDCSDIDSDHCDDDDDDDDKDGSEGYDPPDLDSDSHDDMESSDDDEDADEFPLLMGPFGPIPNPTELFIGGALVLDLIRQFLEAHPEMGGDDTPPPALPEVIASLPRLKIGQEDVDASSSCCICQSDFELDEDSTRLPCNHTFHDPCVTTWLKMHATCPTCRDVLPY